ncbi:hypothetical protein FYK55_25710 [Roseiconus nitratireducens]|uniref:DNA primase n=1 Tax=Roseiconus nitratireducens TaxID=2605748 RepID=A0A5M6CVN4_9BACT|nr:hypothetical protein FYK55_25710 [Roseiconus nitratireducens]
MLHIGSAEQDQPEMRASGAAGQDPEPIVQERATSVEATPRKLPNDQTPAADPATEPLSDDGDQITFVRADRFYRIRGLEKNASTCRMAINLMVSRDELVYLDALDMVKARSRNAFIKAAANELFVDEELVKKDIGALLLKLELRQAERIARQKRPCQAPIRLSERERAEAMELLQDPNLLERIVSDLEVCGIVGENTNKLAGYLAATSRKLSRPLAILIQSSSSAGKTSLMDAILSLMPPEDVVRLSGMTGRSLFYLDTAQIRHKILAVAEDEGLNEAAYALKLLQSEGELRHASVCRDGSGNLVTRQHHVQGPVQIFLTSTSIDVDEELVNRCFVLTVDETDNQTGAIQSRQREAFTSQCFQASQKAARLRRLHQNAQRLLRPLEVLNPYAPQLSFPSHKTRMRRDHLKYLTLINTVALLRQHQRETQPLTGGNGVRASINVEPDDIAVANTVAGQVLGQSLDELAPQTRTLLADLQRYVRRECRRREIPRSDHRFTRRDLRESIQWSDAQVRKHLTRLVELEYVLIHRGRNGQRFVYELIYDGEGCGGEPFLMGLSDPQQLRRPTLKTEPLMHLVPTLSP